jgi:uncharacterized Zn-binding protein involved in type VI secretion
VTEILESAARVTSGVAHVSSTWAQVGAIGGSILGAAFVIGTGGFGAVVLAALAWGGTASFAGSLIDDLQGASITERIKTGAPDVFLDEAKLAAASASPDCITDGDGEAVKTGSDSVFIHGYPASRLTDELHCGGIIKEGSPGVYYGGAFQHDPSNPSKSEPLWLWAFDLVSSVAGLKNPQTAWDWISTGSTLYGLGSELTGVSHEVADGAATGVGVIDAMLLVEEALSK